MESSWRLSENFRKNLGLGLRENLFLPKIKILKKPVSIISIGSVSPLGRSPEEIWNNYRKDIHFISEHDFEGNPSYAAFLPNDLKEEVRVLRDSVPHLRHVDDTVLYSILAARDAAGRASWDKAGDFGINIGSSRGATQLFEKYHKDFMKGGKAQTLTSPTTTLGNISSWVAQDLQSTGPEISHSVTCSTGMHAILNGIAWLQAGMADRFLVGASEAALTPFTVAQMQAMKIYANQDLPYPCQALNMEKIKNSMVLGEGAGAICLEAGEHERTLAKISGIGYATERLRHSVSISANGTCFQKSMKMAMGEIALEEIDVVIMHAPGTIKGDRAELNAVRAVFGEALPALTSNKWKIGHTFGASGIFSLELGILMLYHQEFIPIPYIADTCQPKKIDTILVNAVGFGGNAVSILLQAN